jgi:hypothetical protein
LKCLVLLFILVSSPANRPHMSEENPFLFSRDEEDVAVPASLWAKAMARFARAPPPPPAAPPTIVLANTPHAGAATIVQGFTCYKVVVIALVCVILALGIALVVVSVTNRFADLEAVSNTATSFLTRYAAIQHHYPLAAYFDSYGDETGAADLRTEMTSAKSFARVVGSVDLATLRFDWKLLVNDAHNKLGARMTIALWVQRYDLGTHLMRHVAHSPLVLCGNLTTSTTCEGHLDHPPKDLSVSDDLDTRVLSLALYTGRPVINATTEPVWIVAIIV